MFPYLTTGRLGRTRVKSAHVFYQKYGVFYKTFSQSPSCSQSPADSITNTNQAIQFSFGSSNNGKVYPL